MLDSTRDFFDTWFACGKGLIRLEQRAGDKLTKTWQVVEFTPGAE